MEDKKSEKNGQDNAQFVHRDYLGSFSHLQRFIIADPGGAGSNTGQNKKKPALFADFRNSVLSACKKDDQPVSYLYFIIS